MLSSLGGIDDGTMVDTTMSSFDIRLINGLQASCDVVDGEKYNYNPSVNLKNGKRKLRIKRRKNGDDMALTKKQQVRFQSPMESETITAATAAITATKTATKTTTKAANEHHHHHHRHRQSIAGLNLIMSKDPSITTRQLRIMITTAMIFAIISGMSSLLGDGLIVIFMSDSGDSNDDKKSRDKLKRKIKASAMATVFKMMVLYAFFAVFDWSLNSPTQQNNQQPDYDYDHFSPRPTHVAAQLSSDSNNDNDSGSSSSSDSGSDSE